MNSLTLKWGTAKAWSLETEEAKQALDEWAKYGLSWSAETHEDTVKQQAALINLLQYIDEIWLDWDGRQVTQEEAEEYIRNYGKE